MASCLCQLDGVFASFFFFAKREGVALLGMEHGLEEMKVALIADDIIACLELLVGVYGEHGGMAGSCADDGDMAMFFLLEGLWGDGDGEGDLSRDVFWDEEFGGWSSA